MRDRRHVRFECGESLRAWRVVGAGVVVHASDSIRVRDVLRDSSIDERGPYGVDQRAAYTAALGTEDLKGHGRAI